MDQAVAVRIGSRTDLGGKIGLLEMPAAASFLFDISAVFVARRRGAAGVPDRYPPKLGTFPSRREFLLTCTA